MEAHENLSEKLRTESDEKSRFLRYKRQLSLPGFTTASQEKLFAGSVLILGTSLAARTVAFNLAESGVGRVKIAGDQLGELSACRNFLALAQAPDTELSYQLLTAAGLGDAEALVAKCDVVVDVLSDWQEKLMLSDACMKVGRPLVHSYLASMRAQIYCMVPGRSMCLRCLLVELEMEDYPREAKTREVSELASVSSIVGGFQSLEVIKLLTKLGVSQGNELLLFDALSGEVEVLRGLDPRFDCPDCGSLLGP